MVRKVSLAAFLIFVVSFLAADRAMAIYSWVDEKGVYHISDYPKPTKQQSPEPAAAPKEKTEEPPPAQVEKQAPKDQPAPQQHVNAQPPTTPAAALPAQQQTKTQPQAPQQSQAATAGAPAPTPPQSPASPQPTQPLPRRVPVPSSSQAPSPEALAAFAAFSSVFLFIAVIAYVYFSLCMYLIAKKLNVTAAWTAWVPILNIWTFFASAGKPLWWIILLFIPLANFFVMIYLWMCIVENLGRNKWLGLVMIVPVANIIYLGVLAFSGPGQSSPAASTA